MNSDPIAVNMLHLALLCVPSLPPYDFSQGMLVQTVLKAALHRDEGTRMVAHAQPV